MLKTNLMLVCINAGYTIYFTAAFGLDLDEFGINGMQFSTFDRDRDNYTGHCANMAHGGWWYNRCYLVNPNGMYLPPGTSGGIQWYFFHAGSLRTFKLMFK